MLQIRLWLISTIFERSAMSRH